MSPGDLLAPTPHGLHCPRGGFHIDPSQPVSVAVVTHAHADHARPGSGRYFVPAPSEPLIRHRLGPDADLQPVPFGQPFQLGDVTLSFHPSGHVLGAAQVRLEAPDAPVWVVAGDYKRAPDPTCAPFEVVPCDVFVTESTFALPIFRWPDPDLVMEEILAWWDAGRAEGRPSVLYCYSVGKAQRLLAELARRTERRVWLHGAHVAPTELYRQAGVHLPETIPTGEGARDRRRWAGELILAPPLAWRSPWTRRFKDADHGFASGMMRIRGVRRRRGFDRGFVLSDHADWPDLLRTIADTGARRVVAMHGHADVLARYLNEQGLTADAWAIGGAL